MEKRRILVIAGSDSSGGAGLEADQKVIAAHGCYAMTATTALTAQNTQGVYDIHYIPPAFIRKQIDACIDDIGVDVVKTGMLASADTVDVVADALKKYGHIISIVDPVMVSTSGSQLLPHQAISNLRLQILPLVTVLTPNMPEAKLLLQNAGNNLSDPQGIDDIVKIAKEVHALGPKYVLIKGGHLPLTKEGKISRNGTDEHTVVDVLFDGEHTTLMKTAYLDSRNTHGTGCSLASAIASNVALGYSIPDAVKKACRYIEVAIKTSIDLGRGSGPINHFHSNYTLPFSSGHFIEYLQTHPKIRPLWEAHTQHAFVQQIANGNLQAEKFKYYLVQDYQFLLRYTRALALVASKAQKPADIASSTAVLLSATTETAEQVTYSASFGLSQSELDDAPLDPATTHYTAHLLTLAHASSPFTFHVACAPCLLGYYSIAQRIESSAESSKGKENKYWRWVERYSGGEYEKGVVAGRELLEKHALLQSVHTIETLVDIFAETTKMEIAFWDMALAER